MEVKEPWGISVPPPLEDIERLAKPRHYDSIIDLGSGDPHLALTLSLRFGCIVVACDNSPIQYVHAQSSLLDFPELRIYYLYSDLTSPDNPLLFFGRYSRLLGHTQGEEKIVLANNIFVNLTGKLSATSIVAASITYALQTGGWLFFLDHLRKDRGPFGNFETHARYKERYPLAQLAGRPPGDVWTSSPPRWVHHYTWDEISFLFPKDWYRWETSKTQEYIGDSGKVTNSCYLAAQKVANVTNHALSEHYGLPIRLFEILY